MKRCFSHRCKRLFPVFFLLWAALPGSAGAQTGASNQQVLDANGQAVGVRSFAPGAQRGNLVVQAPPHVLLNGKAERLSPGARIRGVNGIVLMSASLIGHTLPVMYQRETNGLLHELWVLSPAEAQRIALPTPTP